MERDREDGSEWVVSSMNREYVVVGGPYVRSFIRPDCAVGWIYHERSLTSNIVNVA